MNVTQTKRSPCSSKGEEHICPDPPWIRLLHAVHLQWRDDEIMRGNNPDHEIERWLLERGLWPPTKKAN